MGIIQGVLGKMRKSAGDVVFQKSFDKTVFRSKPVSVRNPKTTAQKTQRQKMTLVRTLLSLLISVIRVGWKQRAVKRSAFASAMSYNLQNAVTGTYPAQEIDFPNLKLADGTLEGVLNGSAVLAVGPTGIVDVTWDDNSGIGNALASDLGNIVIFNKTKNTFFNYNTSPRSNGSTSASSQGVVGDILEVYMFFVSADNTIVSNSVFLAELTVV